MPTASSLLTLPNIISSSRLALAVGFVAIDAVAVRLALIGIASFTDFLDGWLARRNRLQTKVGALIDPIADRFFVLAVVVSYVLGAHLSVLQAIGIMFRDVMSVVGWFVARNVSWLRAIPFKARLLGKIVTVAQLITFLIVLLAPQWTNRAVIVVFSIGVLATIDYTLMLWRNRRIES